MAGRELSACTFLLQLDGTKNCKTLILLRTRVPAAKGRGREEWKSDGEGIGECHGASMSSMQATSYQDHLPT